MAEIKDEYIQWPGPATFPGAATTPAYDRYANGNTTVHSHKGWEWVEVDSPYQKAAAALAQSAVETAVQRASTVFGTVYYQRGNATDRPDFDGKAIGDTCRIQDPTTLNIVAEWKWTGLAWERMQVSGEQISNLDVGRLTAGSASINELAARKIAADTGKFLQLTTDQLTVTGNASFVDLTAKHVWSRIVSAEEGEFEKIRAGMLGANSVTADTIQVGALNGQVITGAVVQTSVAANRGLKITDSGMQVFDSTGWKSLDIDAASGNIQIFGRIGRKDSWSECYFNDIVSRDSGKDVAPSGARYGVGLAFNSLQDDWWDGVITIMKASDGSPSLTMQGPLKKSDGTMSPYITVGTTAISMYTTAGSSFSFNANGVFFNGSAAYWYSTGAELAYGKRGAASGSLWVAATQYRLRPTSWSVGGLWASPTAVTMEYNSSNQVWIGSDGVHMTGNKAFTMRVPGETVEHGLWLNHKCTESPYDGIEYWESVVLGEDGCARWVLPDYVPKIASVKAPWVVFAGGGASAVLVRGGYGVGAGAWYVDVVGEPGAVVPVLVKGARMIDVAVGEGGEPVMRDYARESPWGPGAPEAPGVSEVESAGGGVLAGAGGGDPGDLAG